MPAFLKAFRDEDGQLWFSFAGDLRRTEDDIYFLYRWHCKTHPDLLRPAFPSQILLQRDTLDVINRDFGYFWAVFEALCGDELRQHPTFFSSEIKKLKIDQDLDVEADKIIPPVYEWLPSTKRLVRATFSRLRRRSPSPHLHVDEVDREEASFAADERASLQRIRVHEIERSYGVHRVEKLRIENTDEISDYINTRAQEERLYLLQTALNALQKKSLIQEEEEQPLLERLLAALESDESDSESSSSDGEDADRETFFTGEFCFREFVGEEVISAGKEYLESVKKEHEKQERHLIEPLLLQLQDVYCIISFTNRRTELLHRLDKLISQRKSLVNNFSSAKKQAQLERCMSEIQNIQARLLPLQQSIREKYPIWQAISDELILKLNCLETQEEPETESLIKR